MSQNNIRLVFIIAGQDYVPQARILLLSSIRMDVNYGLIQSLPGRIP